MEKEYYPILIWLQMLPDDIYQKAVAAIKKQNVKYVYEEGVIGFAQALSYAFSWSTTPEGWFYWRGVYEKYSELIDEPQLWYRK